MGKLNEEEAYLAETVRYIDPDPGSTAADPPQPPRPLEGILVVSLEQAIATGAVGCGDSDRPRRSAICTSITREGDRNVHEETEQHHPHRRRLGVGERSCPRRVCPGQKYREIQHQGFRPSRPGEMGEQVVRQLSDREDVDQVEESSRGLTCWSFGWRCRGFPGVLTSTLPMCLPRVSGPPAAYSKVPARPFRLTNRRRRAPRSR